MSNVIRTFEKDEYVVDVEQVEDVLFLHCTLKIDKLSTYKLIKKDIPEVFGWAKSLGYKDICSLTRNKRFAEFIPNAVHIKDLRNEDEVWGVYLWHLV